MSGYARIDSVDSLRMFRGVLVKFAEVAQVSLADAEGEMQRVLMWLETEASTYWSGQIRKRHENVEKCKDAVRQKKLFKSPTGSTQSAVEEEKQLRIAQKRLEEAEEKLKNVKRYTPRLQKEISIYKGGVQRLSTTVSADIPVAISRLDRMTAALEAYAALSMSGGGADDSGQLFAQMAKAMGEDVDAGPDYRPMRQKTANVDRKAATPGDVRLVTWADGGLPEQERELFSKIATDRKIPKPEDLVIVEQGAWENSKIYMERVNFEDGDSGWFLGKAEDGPSMGNISMSIADLLQSRTDLTEILTLGPGFLLTIDATGVTAVLDEKGKEVWAGIIKT